MYKGTITSDTTVTANQTIPFNTILNTNSNTSANNGVVSLKKTGFYNVDAMIVITDVAAGDVGLEMYANETVIPEATASATSGATTDAITLNIHDALKISESSSGTAQISIQLTENATITSACMTVELLQ